MSKILIVEDEESIADLEKDYLELSGFEVEIENQGDTGLVRAIKEDFDLLILDLMLPEVDGFEICREVREKKDIPIIMVSAKKDDIDLMVFDEVDTGVGGKTAQMMAEKIARIALYRQVICITHLPQIAAMADAHFYISKETKNNKTFTTIDEINYDAKLAEIARMSSGIDLTQASLENAEEMLTNARKRKELLHFDE